MALVVWGGYSAAATEAAAAEVAAESGRSSPRSGTDVGPQTVHINRETVHSRRREVPGTPTHSVDPGGDGDGRWVALDNGTSARTDRNRKGERDTTLTSLAVWKHCGLRLSDA